jgi:spore cortex biosynthesis protein YabQ
LESPVAEQAWILAITVLAGMVVGLLFDACRVGRKVLRPSRRLLFLVDLLFWFLAALFVFLMLLAVNRGEVRAYVFVGLSAGWALYVLFFSRTCLGLMLATVSVLLSFSRTLLFPFKHLFHFCRKLLSRLKKPLLLPLAHSKRQLNFLKDRFHKKQE